MFGNILKKARLAKGLSQYDLARKINKTASFISTLENDRTNSIDPDTLRNICSELHLDFIEMLAIVKPQIADAIRKLEDSLDTSEDIIRIAQRKKLIPSILPSDVINKLRTGKYSSPEDVKTSLLLLMEQHPEMAVRVRLCSLVEDTSLDPADLNELIALLEYKINARKKRREK